MSPFHPSCPIWHPFSREGHLLPHWLRFTKGKVAESWVVFPLLLTVLAVLPWRDAGAAIAAHAQTSAGK
jgi:hypothetical protein